MAVPCMPSSARMPIEKMRIPISASISITPACFWFVRMAVSLVAEPWIGVVGHGRVAHAHLPRGRNVEAEAAHRARGLASAAARIADVDARERNGNRAAHAAQPGDLHRAGGIDGGRGGRAGDHRVRRAFCAAALLDRERRGRVRGAYVAAAGGPAVEMSRRRQRIAPAGWQAPPLVLLTLMRVSGTATALLTRPSPVKITVLAVLTVAGAFVPAITAFGVPSAPLRFWIASGAAVSEGFTSHRPVGSWRLTIQFVPVSASAHAAVSVSTSWKRTGALRRRASARANCSPAWSDSAEVRSCWFCSQVFIDGNPTMSSSATTARVVSSSIRVKPCERLFMGSAIRGFLPHPAARVGRVALVRHGGAAVDHGGLDVRLIDGEVQAAETLRGNAVGEERERLVSGGVRGRVGGRAAVGEVALVRR